MEAAADEERPLLHLQPLLNQDVGSEYTSDGSVDINNQPALKHNTGNWRACYMILGVEFCECVAFFAIASNLVTYLTTVLHESKVAAARDVSAWVGACFLAPLIGAFLADTYLGRYWTMVVSLPVYTIISTASTARLTHQFSVMIIATLNTANLTGDARAHGLSISPDILLPW
ncbi:hypothetical protein ACQJBY_031242 [Aegilops geniculata]